MPGVRAAATRPEVRRRPRTICHRAGSRGAQCAWTATCRRATYMVVDARHDHSFRVPRPEFSRSSWACRMRAPAATRSGRRVGRRRRTPGYGTPTAGSSATRTPWPRPRPWRPGPTALLETVARDAIGAAIARASAARAPDVHLGAAPSICLPSGLRTMPIRWCASPRRRRSRAPSPHGAASSSSAPLLADPFLAVRLEAAGHALAGVAAPRPPDRCARAALDHAFAEYRRGPAVQRRSPGSARQPRRLVGAAQRRPRRRARRYGRPSRSTRRHVPAAVNLADLYRDGSAGPRKAERVLRDVRALDQRSAMPSAPRARAPPRAPGQARGRRHPRAGSGGAAGARARRATPTCTRSGSTDGPAKPAIEVLERNLVRHRTTGTASPR